MSVFMKATRMSPNKNGEVFRQSRRQQHSRDLEPKSGTVEVCTQRIFELSHHETRFHLFWSLSPVTLSCGQDFAGHLTLGTA